MTANPRDTQFPGHGYMDDLTTEHSFDLLATWVNHVFGLFLTRVYLYNQTLANVWSSGAGNGMSVLYHDRKWSNRTFESH